jgi:hypothetical protein
MLSRGCPEVLFPSVGSVHLHKTWRFQEKDLMLVHIDVSGEVVEIARSRRKAGLSCLSAQARARRDKTRQAKASEGK